MAAKATEDPSIAEGVIVSAVDQLTMKIEKQHQKHCKKQKKSTGCFKNRVAVEEPLSTECNCMKLKSNVEGGRNSPLISSPVTNRKSRRREGVAEQNEQERSLTREAVKEMAKVVNLEQYDIILVT